MAMVHCRGCGETIHESATTCPKCGAPQGVPAASGSHGPLPEGVRGWSWGAFLFNWVWGIFNGTWISLLTLIPFVGWIMAIVLGAKGREWAWRNKSWKSVEHFQRVQRLWSIWAVSLYGGVTLLGIFAAIALPAYQDYTMRARKAAAVSAQEDARQAEAARLAPAVPAAPPPAPAVVAAPAPVAPVAVVPVTVERVAMAPSSQPAVPASVTQDLIGRAQSCADARGCVQVMLDGAVPRRPEVLAAAAARLSAFEMGPAGDRKASRALNTQALAKYSVNDFAGAAELFAQAAQINPRDAEIQSNLGLALIRSGKPDDALGALTMSLQLAPRRSSAWAPLAEGMDKLRRPEATNAALLLVYEFSGNRQKTMEFFRSRSVMEDVPETMRVAYASALRMIEVGY